MATSGTYVFNPSVGEIVLSAYSPYWVNDPSRDIYKGPRPSLDETDALCVVYGAFNKARMGQSYVGCTSRGLPARKRAHLASARRGQAGHFYNAIRKYGADAFYWRVLEVCRDFPSALSAEAKSIRILRPEYNLTLGGEGVTGHRHSTASKEKMSLAKRGKPSVWTRRPMPADVRQKLAAARRAERGVKVLTEEAKASARANASLANVARRRGVVCISDGTEYASVTEAAQHYGLTTGQVSRYCTVKTGRRNGLRFRRIGEA